jgi:hypothetical protein
MVRLFQDHQRLVVCLMGSQVSVLVVGQLPKSYGEDWNLAQRITNNFQLGQGVMVEDQEVGSYIQPFAKFSLN